MPPGATLKSPGDDSEYKNWSGARDLNPGPHGREICLVSSTETVFTKYSLNHFEPV